MKATAGGRPGQVGGAPRDTGELAARPVLNSAPRAVGYDAQFGVSSPDAASIKKLALVRLGAVTHSVNMEQRYVPLSFTQTKDGMTSGCDCAEKIEPAWNICWSVRPAGAMSAPDTGSLPQGAS